MKTQPKFDGSNNISALKEGLPVDLPMITEILKESLFRRSNISRM